MEGLLLSLDQGTGALSWREASALGASSLPCRLPSGCTSHKLYRFFLLFLSLGYLFLPVWRMVRKDALQFHEASSDAGTNWMEVLGTLEKEGGRDL